jgi:hypothetical protein
MQSVNFEAKLVYLVSNFSSDSFQVLFLFSGQRIVSRQLNIFPLANSFFFLRQDEGRILSVRLDQPRRLDGARFVGGPSGVDARVAGIGARVRNSATFDGARRQRRER